MLKYAVTRNVHDLTRGTDEAAGIDFYVPEYDEKFMNDLIKKNPNAHVRYELTDISDGDKVVGHKLYITLLPGSRILIPSGILTAIEQGTMLMAANKSGVSTKQGLVYTAEIVDSDYAGEVHLGIANFTDEPTKIVTGQKLVQFIHTPVILSKPEKVSVEEHREYHSNSARGDKGFGSNVSASTK
jgi:dUTP pyrophosphatase